MLGSIRLSKISRDEAFSPPWIQAVRSYIKETWKTLSRSPKHILEAIQDPKIEQHPHQPKLLYISPQEDQAAIESLLKSILPSADLSFIEVRVLPEKPAEIQDHGLLYLPHDYVVPGGRFNEMYGWDSYFIQLGLIQDGELDLAQSMVDQLLYEVEHYGAVLNANRTYLLERSQPPFLSLMVLKGFEQSQDQNWLQSALPILERYYQFWVSDPHLEPTTGLSRYYALGEGPAPEVLMSEKDDQGRSHYDRVQEYYQQFEVTDYDLSQYYQADRDRLTDLFYKGDRSMRESGFDITNRFGPFSVDIIHYIPVCLNTLLYQMEQDIAQIYDILTQPDLAQMWRDRAKYRQQQINQFLWDEGSGLYFDYNFQTQQRRVYEFATTFYPLWAGIATPQQAAKVVENLSIFEAVGGLLTSSYMSGNQWDAPFGWAPLNWVAVKGLQRYGYQAEARRIAQSFLTMVIQEFAKTGTIFEKYDVCTCSGNVSEEIFFGYSSNEIGFGWTNAVVLQFLSFLEMGDC